MGLVGFGAGSDLEVNMQREMEIEEDIVATGMVSMILVREIKKYIYYSGTAGSKTGLENRNRNLNLMCSGFRSVFGYGTGFSVPVQFFWGRFRFDSTFRIKPR